MHRFFSFTLCSIAIAHRQPSLFPSSRSSSFARAMTTENITSPPNSPPAKRVKTIAEDTMTSSNGTNGSTVPVTQLDQSPPLLIKKLSDKARLPTRGSAFAAGYDIYASKATVVPARGKVLVDTDISMAVPAGTCKLPTLLFPCSPPSFSLPLHVRS